MQALGSIKYWRIAGTLSQATQAENSYNPASYNGNAAETFILSPECTFLTGSGQPAVRLMVRLKAFVAYRRCFSI